MSRPKLTNTAEELEKLFRVYPEIVPAYGWVQRHQDRLTAPIHVEEFEREDNAGTTLVPMFVVDNDDDRRMLYSNLREGKNYVINILQTAPLEGTSPRPLIRPSGTFSRKGRRRNPQHRCYFPAAVGNTPDMVTNPSSRFTRSSQRRIAG